MRYITKLFMLLFVSVISFSASSQTQTERERIIATYDLVKLNQLKSQAQEEFEKNRQKALELAAIHGWSEHYEFENGGVGYLIGTVDGKPVYYETKNKGAATTARVDRVNTGGTAGLDLNGENMLVGVWDGGLVRESHQLFENRATHIDTSNVFSNHATHVTGTIIGSGTFQSGNAKGMAPMAESINYSFLIGSDAAGVLAAINDSVLLVSNHSYGFGPATLPLWVFGKYLNTGANQQSSFWDQIQFDAPFYMPVWAAGNSRSSQFNPPINQVAGGYDLLTAQGVSKNNLVVAATTQVDNYLDASSVNMASFSSWGPTDDGRIKPDISAKGVNTFSSVATEDNSYQNFSGTSMAAPSVSGALLLLQEHYNNLNNEFMRSSTLRGLVIHTADEAGAAPGPDFRFGWGLINTERAAQVISNNGTTTHILERVLADGQSLEITGTAVSGERLVASITWIDKPWTTPTGGSVNTNISLLVNDLDMRIFDANNDVHMPWIIEFDHSDPDTYSNAASTGDNNRDNVEKIEIDNATGDYTIVISHKGTLDAGEQAVSVIISGIEDIEETLGTPSNEFLRTSIFPNPATNELNVQALTQISSLEIINLLGQTMGTYEVNANSTKIDIANLKTGTYFLRVTIDTASKVYKFIKR